jgi:hypothetical protein
LTCFFGFEQVILPRSENDLKKSELGLKLVRTVPYLVVNVGYIHNVKDFIIKVILQNATNDVKGQVDSTLIKPRVINETWESSVRKLSIPSMTNMRGVVDSRSTVIPLD